MNDCHLCSDVDPDQVSILHNMGVTNVGIALILRTSVVSISRVVETLDLEDNYYRLKDIMNS